MSLGIIPIFSTLVILTILTCADVNSASSDVEPQNRLLKSIRFPWPIGHFCNGCPPHYCETDPGIVLGYCCGCRRLFDILPIICTANVICPLDISGVCHDYEYMLHCCC